MKDSQDSIGHSPIITLPKEDFPSLLCEINDPPKTLYLRGALPTPDLATLVVVGSRKHTAYGKECTQKLIAGLRGYPIAIVSGLALGIDGVAHESALDAGLFALAVPGSGLDDDVLYPRTHLSLAQRILESGGGLLSEYPHDMRAALWTFPRRNRIMAGLGKAVLIIEAPEKSGTLITARLATEYNRDILALPGPITSLTSHGPNRLIQDGATPILSSADILDALEIAHVEAVEEDLSSLPPAQRTLFEALTEPIDRDTLFALAGQTPEEGNRALLELELVGKVRSTGGIISRA